MRALTPRIWTFLIILIFFLGCNDSGSLFKPIGTELASPIAIAVDTTNLRAYVVNSNNRYEFSNTTLSILDITDPAAPTLLSAVDPISIPNFSGQIYFDAAARNAYVTNRVSDGPLDKTDTLLKINLDESSASFRTVTQSTAGENPFGIACCDASGRIYEVSTGGTVDVFNPADLSTSVQISLAATLKSGEHITGANATEVALLGTTQAFVTARGGRIYVINTVEVGDSSKNPIDTILLNVGDARGIATDGTSLFVVDGTTSAPILRVINPATLTLIDPDTTTISEVDVSTIQTTSVVLGADPNEVVVFGGKAYVTNRGSDSVTVYDIASSVVTMTIPVGDEPFGLAAFTVGASSYLYVTNLVGESISVIDLASNTVVSTFP